MRWLDLGDPIVGLGGKRRIGLLNVEGDDGLSCGSVWLHVRNPRCEDRATRSDELLECAPLDPFAFAR